MKPISLVLLGTSALNLGAVRLTRKSRDHLSLLLKRLLACFSGPQEEQREGARDPQDPCRRGGGGGRQLDHLCEEPRLEGGQRLALQLLPGLRRGDGRPDRAGRGRQVPRVRTHRVWHPGSSQEG